MITIVTLWLCLITHVACDVVITVNNNGRNNDKCCLKGRCPCSSLSSALHDAQDSTTINITSNLVTLYKVVEMRGNLNNITITGNGATIICNNNGGVYCESCSEITIMGITWQECGQNDPRVPETQIPVLTFSKVSNIHIEDCSFHNSSGCPVYLYCNNAMPEIFINNTNFVGNIFQVPYGSCDTVTAQYCAGLYIIANSPIVLKIHNSNFEGNGCPLSGSECCHCSAVVESGAENYQYSIINTNFTNNFNGLCLNPNGVNEAIYISDINVYDHLGTGISIQIINNDFFRTAVCTAFILSATFKNNTGDLITTAFNPSLSLTILINNSIFNNPPNSISQFGVEIISASTLNVLTVSNTKFYNNHNRAVGITTYNLTECIWASISFTNVIVYNTTKLITTKSPLPLVDDGAGIYIVTQNTFGSITFESVNFTSIHFPKQNEGALVITNQFTDCTDTIPIPGIFTLSVELINCTFVNNTAPNHVVPLNIIVSEDLAAPVNHNYVIAILLSGCSFDHNIGGDSIVYVTVPTYKDLYQPEIIMILNNATFSNNKGTALNLFISQFKLKGNILFINNSASSGAAVYLEEVHTISSDDNAIVQFINNTVKQKGGAMYVNLVTGYCDVFDNITNPSNLFFINNSADIAGNSIFFSIPQTCQIITNASNTASMLYVPNKFNYSQPPYIESQPVVTSPYTTRLYPPTIAVYNSSNDYSIQEPKMLGEPIQFTASVLDYFNNITEPVIFSIDCETCGDDYVLSTYLITLHNQSLNELKVFPTEPNDVTEIAIISLKFLSVLSPVYKSITFSLSLKLSSCYPGYLFDKSQRQCICYPYSDVVHCTEQYSEIKIGYWIGLLTEQQYTLSICPSEYCNFAKRTETSEGYYDVPRKPDDQCNSHRTGLACGECKSGYTLAYDSPDCINKDKCSAGMTILVIVLTILYWITIVSGVFCLMYARFKIPLGYVYAIIYYYSIVDVLLINDDSEGTSWLLSILSSFAKLTPQLFGQLCLVEGLSGIDQQFIHYSHALAVSLILLIIVLAARRSGRLTRFVGPCIIRVICLLLLLSYTSLASASLQLLRPLKFDDVNEVRTYSSPDIKYFTGRHLAYAIVAILCEVIIVIGLPLFLFLEPFMTHLSERVNFVRIQPLLDEFQNSYKGRYRWFAAYYLICRQVIFLIVYVGNGDYYKMLYYLQTACVIIAMIHMCFQPYKKNILNALDGVILLILVLVVNLNTFSFLSSAVLIVLVVLPLFVLISFASVGKFLSRCCNKRNRFMRLFNPVEGYGEDEENDDYDNHRR